MPLEKEKNNIVYLNGHTDWLNLQAVKASLMIWEKHLLYLMEYIRATFLCSFRNTHISGPRKEQCYIIIVGFGLKTMSIYFSEYGPTLPKMSGWNHQCCVMDT